MARATADYQVTVFIHHETDKALLLSTDNDKESAQWLPKSQIKDIEETGKIGQREITLPEWKVAELGWE